MNKTEQPVAYMGRCAAYGHPCLSKTADGLIDVEPLYAAPQAAPAPKRLTDEQIRAVWSAQGSFTERDADNRMFARAIESAVLRLNGLEE